MSNLIPINHSFQRLYNFALDDTYICDTIEDAQNYASYNDLAYKGQLVFVKEFRKAENKMDEEIKSALYYIDETKRVQPVCWFDYDCLVALLELLKKVEYIKNMNGVLSELKNQLIGPIRSDYDYYIISRQPITLNDYVFDNGEHRRQVEFVSSAQLEDGTYEQTFRLKDGHTHLTDFIFGAFRKKEPIYAIIPLLKETNLYPYFADCTYLEYINLLDIDLSSITNMQTMFSGCVKLSHIENISNWDVSNITQMNQMFQDCHSLVSLDLNKWNIENVTSIFGIFQNCISLTSVSCSNWNTSKVTSMHYMFFYCPLIESLDLSNWDTKNVTSFSNMFALCYALTTIGNIVNWDTKNVTTMINMFYDCKSLTSLNVSDWDTSKVYDFSNMFENCENLKIIGIENFNFAGALHLDSMFENCKSLTHLDLSKGKTTYKLESMASMFYGCENLEEVNLSGWYVSALSRLYAGFGSLFGNCSKLKKVNLSGWSMPERFDQLQMKNMFNGCTSLTREGVITDGCSEHTIKLIDEYFASL